MAKKRTGREGPTGVQLLDSRCSTVSVRVLLLSTHLVSTQCWILNNMFAVLMHIIYIYVSSK